MNPEGRLTFLVLRPLNDMVLWLWRLERRAEFLYRPQFDRWLRPRLFAMTQKLRNARRTDDGLKLAEERQFPCLLYTSPSPRDRQKSRMPSSA